MSPHESDDRYMYALKPDKLGTWNNITDMQMVCLLTVNREPEIAVTLKPQSME